MSFTFGLPTPPLPGTQVRVPRGIEAKRALLEALYAVLNLPDYFGTNWDAFEECIRDLSWMPPGPIVLIHEDIPLASNEKDLATYLAILRDAAAKWERQGTRSLTVIFPSAARPVVTAVMGSPA